mmetsp:Transcript_50510/g.60910  ORF Transcript_50510/g.60910 Transcript_50510/m.60910 type:complete len:123 (+) Transcript_50510:312-680(+)
MSSLVPSNNYNHKRIASNRPWRSDGIENAENVRDGVSQLRQNSEMKQVRSSKHDGGAENGVCNNPDMVTIEEVRFRPICFTKCPPQKYATTVSDFTSGRAVGRPSACGDMDILPPQTQGCYI